MTQTAQPVDLATQLSKVKAQEASNREIEIRLTAEQESVARELKAAQEEAVKKFNTSDLDALRNMYRQFLQEDREAITAFSAVVQRRTDTLNDIQRRLNEHRSGSPVREF